LSILVAADASHAGIVGGTCKIIADGAQFCIAQDGNQFGIKSRLQRHRCRKLGAVPSPAAPGRVLLPRTGMHGAGLNLVGCIDDRNANRCTDMVGKKLDSALVIAVVTPAPDRAVASDSARMLAACRNRDEILNRYGARDGPRSMISRAVSGIHRLRFRSRG